LKALVAYASRYGSTKGIAEFIAENLRKRGIPSDAMAVESIPDPGGYDAYVIGSAVYMSHWTKEASKFVRRNRTMLATKPVWLFSSGPLGTNKEDPLGRDLFKISESREFPELKDLIKAREHRIFPGALDPNRLTLSHKVVRRMPAAMDLMPEGDFRDWKEIEEWADGIARQLRTTSQ